MSYHEQPQKHILLERQIAELERKLARAKTYYARRPLVWELVRVKRELKEYLHLRSFVTMTD